tara:strand:+ start:72 stop:989 length:918 start_codon:yes stop_codon:yes gene_type:complete
MVSTKNLIKTLKKRTPEPKVPMGTDMFLPNHSGDLSAGQYPFTDGSVIFAENQKLTENNEKLFFNAVTWKLGVDTGTVGPDRTITGGRIDSPLNLFLSMKTASDKAGGWAFNDGIISVDDQGRVTYTHTTDTMGFWTDGALRVNIDSTGALTFIDAGAMIYGNFWGNEIGETMLGTEFGGGFAIVNNGNITAGETSNTTFQNDQEILITIEGRYKIDYSVSVRAGVGQHIVAGIGKGGTVQNCGQAHSVMPAGNAETTIASTAILDLAVNDTISIMIDNESGNATPANDVDIEHISLSLIQVGGT